MESQAPQLIRAARKKAKDKIWHVLSTIVIFGTCLALTIVYWPVAEEESAILMLSTLKSTNVPWVISLNGEFKISIIIKKVILAYSIRPLYTLCTTQYLYCVN